MKFDKKKDTYNILSEEKDPSHSHVSGSPLIIGTSLNQALLKTPPHSIEMTKYYERDSSVFSKSNRSSLKTMHLINKITIISLVGTLQIILSYIITDIRKKPRSFKIGVFSIFIVVSFLIILQSAKHLTPALFIRLSEAQTGDSDLTLRNIALENDTRLTNDTFKSNPLHGLRTLNGKMVERICDELEEVEGCSARWLLLGKTMKNGKEIKTFVIIIDEEKERSIGLGRNTEINKERLGENECFLTDSTVRSLDIQDKLVELNIDVLGSLVSQESFAFLDHGGSDHSSDDALSNLKNELKSLINSSIQTGFDSLSKNLTDKNFNFQGLLMNFSHLLPPNLNFFSNIFNIYDLSNLTTINSLQANLKEIINITLDAFIDTLNFTKTLKIKDSIRSPRGKYPSILGNVMLLDYKIFTESIIEVFMQNFRNLVNNDMKYSFFSFLINDEELLNSIKSQVLLYFDLKRYAMLEYLTLKDKLHIYEDEKSIDKKMVEFSNKFSKALGKNYTSQSDIALSGVVKKMSIIKGFLDNVFAASVILLLMLSVLLIYSLMLSNVEEKTFEFGMLRALGFNQTHVMLLLLIQALIYAFLGMFLAFMFGFILNCIICYIIYDFSLLADSYMVPDSAMILGFSIGLIMPIISNILPIARALSKTLRDSLDLFHREINVFKVRVMKLEKLGISLYQSLNACILIVMGFSAYYLAPRAFIMRDIQLFLAIMNMILIIFLVGLTVFLNLFQGLFEKLTLKILLYVLCFDLKLEAIIKKNIQSHQTRNLKTALMFSITMSFLIFASTGFQLQETVIKDTLKIQIGADMTVEISANTQIGLDEYKIRQFLDAYMVKYPNNLDKYTFVSIPLDQIPNINLPKLTPLCHYPVHVVSVRGVESNFLQTVYTNFFIPTEYDESLSYNKLSTGQRDSVSGLYLEANQQNYTKIYDVYNLTSNHRYRPPLNAIEESNILRFILPEGVRYVFGLDPTIPAMMILGRHQLPSKIITMVAKMPGFGMFFSSYKTASKMVLTSMETYEYLMKKDLQDSNIDEGDLKDFYKKQPKNMSHNIPKEKLYIKYKKVLNEIERIELANGLRNNFNDIYTMLFDTEEFIADSSEAFYYLDIFYYIVALIAIILSFFLILVSFHTNVKEHVWEFGILRALGLNKAQMTRIYIYEAACLTISAGLIGTMVGVIVALVLTVQYLTFAEIPLNFHFPMWMFSITFCSGVSTAVLGSYLALKEIRDRSIANIIKGLN